MQQNGSDDGNEGRSEEVPPQDHPAVTTLIVAGISVRIDSLKAFLKSQGHSILTATSTADALAKTRRFKPAFILLHSGMETDRASDLIPELLMVHSRAALIMMAALPPISEVVESIKLGAVDYLEWPLDFSRLKKALDVQRDQFSGN